MAVRAAAVRRPCGTHDSASLQATALIKSQEAAGAQDLAGNLEFYTTDNMKKRKGLKYDLEIMVPPPDAPSPRRPLPLSLSSRAVPC